MRGLRDLDDQLESIANITNSTDTAGIGSWVSDLEEDNATSWWATSYFEEDDGSTTLCSAEQVEGDVFWTKVRSGIMFGAGWFVLWSVWGFGKLNHCLGRWGLVEAIRKWEEEIEEQCRRENWSTINVVDPDESNNPKGKPCLIQDQAQLTTHLLLGRRVQDRSAPPGMERRRARQGDCGGDEGSSVRPTAGAGHELETNPGAVAGERRDRASGDDVQASARLLRHQARIEDERQPRIKIEHRKCASCAMRYRKLLMPG